MTEMAFDDNTNSLEAIVRILLLTIYLDSAP